MIADVNSSSAVFSIFDGALKAGGEGACTDRRARPREAANEHWHDESHRVAGIVDTKDPNLFEFEPRMVAANVG